MKNFVDKRGELYPIVTVEQRIGQLNDDQFLTLLGIATFSKFLTFNIDLSDKADIERPKEGVRKKGFPIVFNHAGIGYPMFKC